MADDKCVSNEKKKRERSKNSAKSCKADSPKAHLEDVTVISWEANLACGDHLFWILFACYSVFKIDLIDIAETMAEMSKAQNVVVVGAGPVGALAALYAAERGDDVHVYELRAGKISYKPNLIETRHQHLPFFVLCPCSM